MAKRKSGILLILLLTLTLLFVSATSSYPYMESDVNAAIDAGLAWLAENQNIDGSWNYWGQPSVGATGEAVLAFANRGYLPGSGGTYSAVMENGLQYLLNHAYEYPINIQPAGDPDSNGNGIGIYFNEGPQLERGLFNWGYNTGIAMTAIVASVLPDVTVPYGLFTGRLFRDIITDTVDMCAWAQNEGCPLDPMWSGGRGGWRYEPNSCDSDNSVSQWPVLGMYAAESSWGVTIPPFVKSELSIWIDYIQDDFTGGSGYDMAGLGTSNIARTGALLAEMAFFGDDRNTPRAQQAMQYIADYWSSDFDHPTDPQSMLNYYAYYAVAKGCRMMDVELLPPTGMNLNWYEEYVNLLLASQQPDGSWPNGIWGDPPLATAWSILVLNPVVIGTTVPPVADAGPDHTVMPGEIVYLDGFSSYHPDPSRWIANYEWDLDNDGIYENPGPVAWVSFPFPGTYTVRLRVTDDNMPPRSDIDACNITVLWTQPQNRPPSAGAGPDQTVEQDSFDGAFLTLNGSLSDLDSGPLYYSWYVNGALVEGGTIEVGGVPQDPLVNQAISNGAGWLLGQDLSMLSMGQKSLVAYTLLHAGLPEPDIQFLIDDISGYLPGDVYESALKILTLGATGNDFYMPFIQQEADTLAASQFTTGGWGYWLCQSPCMDTPPSGGEDMSHVQYALLGLYRAAQKGASVNPSVWDAAAAFLERAQQPDGGWGYYEDGTSPGWDDGIGSPSYGSMTAAGVMGLEICQSMGASVTASALDNGMNWLINNYTFNTNCSNPGAGPQGFVECQPGQTWMYYNMYSVERAMAVSASKQFLGTYDWYTDLSGWLLMNQSFNGSWQNECEGAPNFGEVTSLEITCFALLTLERATASASQVNLSYNFPLGSHYVDLCVNDYEYNVCDNAMVTVVDTTPPDLICPAPVTLDQGSGQVPVPMVTDICDTAPLITSDAPPVFPPGTTTVTFTATDSSGNSAQCQTTVTVEQDNPPAITCPTLVTVEQESADGAVVALTATATDDLDPAPVITDDAPVIFPLGATTVTFTATDFSGNSAQCQTTVTVADTTPPAITCPDPATVEQESADGTTVALTATATDICDAAPAVTDNAPAIFPLGATTVTFTATDFSGNSAQCQTTVTVADTTPPSLTCPAPATVEQESADGTAVALTATATDICDAAPAVTDNAPVVFPLGETTVTFTATDFSGNSAQCQTTVTVADTTPPAITCPDPITVEQESADGTTVALTATAADICDAAPLVTDNAPAVFPLGETTVTFTATDFSGNLAQCQTTVTVADTTPPIVESFTVEPSVLWPPNHKMVEITTINIQATDICDAGVSSPAAWTLDSIVMNEGDEEDTFDQIYDVTLGDGHTVNDIQVIDQRIFLRAERSGGGEGRTYTIYYSVTDASGNTTQSSAKVTVPHDMQ